MSQFQLLYCGIFTEMSGRRTLQRDEIVSPEARHWMQKSVRKADEMTIMKQGGGSMQNILLLLYFEEEAYGRRLLRFLSEKKNPFFRPELVTGRKQLTERENASSKKTIILTDQTKVYEGGKEKTILLTGEQDRGEKKIFQYQCAEAIYKELLDQLNIKSTAQQYAAERKEGSGVFLLFSLDGCGITATAVMLSQYLGQYRKCLYMSCSGFPVFYSDQFSKKPDFQKKGLDELLFCSGKEAFVSRLQSTVQKFGNADLLAPSAHFRDLFDCSGKDWSGLLEKIQKEGGYDSVVIEIDQLFESVMELFELGEHILVFSQNNAFGKVRREVFRRYCRMEGKEALLARVQFRDTPGAVGEWENGLAQQSVAEWSGNSPVMREMELLWTEERGEEENVCLLEDFD